MRRELVSVDFGQFCHFLFTSVWRRFSWPLRSLWTTGNLKNMRHVTSHLLRFMMKRMLLTLMILRRI